MPILERTGADHYTQQEVAPSSIIYQNLLCRKKVIQRQNQSPKTQIQYMVCVGLKFNPTNQHFDAI
jgi:hypothetical protein